MNSRSTLMSEKFWINGEYSSKDEKPFSVSLSTIHYGLSAFEGILCVNGKQVTIFRLQEHIERFFNSAAVLDLKLPYSRKEFANVIKDVIRINGHGSYYIRPIVFRNSEYLDLTTRNKQLFVAVLCKRFILMAFLLQMRRKLKVIISKNVRNVWGNYLTRAKLSGKYLISAVAKLEAEKSGSDDAILLDDRSMISEATTANIFIVKDGIIKIPFLNNSLNGITQDSVIRIAHDMGYKVIEADIDLDQLYNADEIFLTSTARGLTSISKVDDYSIGDKTKIAEELRNRYIDIIKGSNSKYAEWLTII